jgi:hypothetical protein
MTNEPENKSRATANKEDDGYKTPEMDETNNTMGTDAPVETNYKRQIGERQTRSK